MRILGPSAGPQQTLRVGPVIGEPHPPVGVEHIAIDFVRPLRHGNAQAVTEFLGRLARHRAVPAADKDREPGPPDVIFAPPSICGYLFPERILSIF